MMDFRIYNPFYISNFSFLRICCPLFRSTFAEKFDIVLRLSTRILNAKSKTTPQHTFQLCHTEITTNQREMFSDGDALSNVNALNMVFVIFKIIIPQVQTRLFSNQIVDQRVVAEYDRTLISCR
jgi:hypothetical protein